MDEFFGVANATATDIKATLKSKNEVFMLLTLWSGGGLCSLIAFSSLKTVLPFFFGGAITSAF